MAIWDRMRHGTAAGRVASWLGALALLVAGCATGPPPVEHQRWHRFETAHFGLWSSADDEVSAALLRDLERFRGALPQFSSLEPLPGRIEAVAFAEGTTLARFAHERGARALPVPTLAGTILLVNASVVEPFAALRHAYLHEILRRRKGRLPAWAEEGLAEYLAHAAFAESKVVLGRLPEHFRAWLTYGTRLPAIRVLGAGTSRVGWSIGERRRFQAQSWLLVTLSHGPGALADTPLAARLRELARPSDGTSEEPSTRVPAGTAAPVEAAVQAQLEAGMYPRTEVALELPPPADVARIDRPLGEALAQLRRVAWATGTGGGPTAPPGPDAGPGSAAADAFRAALSRDPGDAAAAEGLAATYGTGPEDAAAEALLLRIATGAVPGVPRLERALAERLRQAGQGRASAEVLSRLARRPHAPALVAADEVTQALASVGISLDEADAALWNAQLAVDVPAEDAVLEQLAPWVEVRGSAGLGSPLGHDVVIVLDISNDTFLPSGQDIDQDGHTGGLLPERMALDAAHLSSDRDDTVLEAERWVAEELILEMDAATTRVGVVGHATQGYEIAPLAAPAETLERLERFRNRPRMRPGTSPAKGLRAALAMLRGTPSTGPPRQGTVLLIAGTRPDRPNARRARVRTAEAAQVLRELGNRVHTLAVGDVALDHLQPFLATVAEAGGGDFQPVPEVRNARLPTLGSPLRGLSAVEIHNRTTGAVARAERTFPDGSLDALVPLVPGTNEIEIVAKPSGREPIALVRTVRFEPPQESDVAHRRKDARLLWALRNRSIEVAARLDIAEAQADRATRDAALAERTVEIEADASNGDLAAPRDDAAVGETLPPVGARPGGDGDDATDEQPSPAPGPARVREEEGR